MKLTKYHPPIRRLQEDFARRLALKRMMRGKKSGPKTITDNSEPWLANPDGVADYWYIASMVNQRVEEWKARQTVF